MFWDASALVPLIILEERTADLAPLASADSDFTIWWGTPLECRSAFYRRFRAGVLSAGQLDRSLNLLDGFAVRAGMMQPTDFLRERAGRFLAVHALRAADALQLAASLIWCEDQPRGASFVCLDVRLREAARQEGYTLVPEAISSTRIPSRKT